MKRDAESARWLLERGTDQMGTGAWFLIGCFALPPLAVVLLPFGLWEFFSGRKKRQEGRSINKELGLPNTERKLSYWTAWDGFGSNGHRHPAQPDYREDVPIHPPA